MIKPTLILVAALAAVLVSEPVSTPAHASPGESCASRFPEAGWVTVSDGPVSVETVGVS